MGLNVVIGRKIVQGKAVGIVNLPWDGNIGAFIVGRPGSGKSHVIASLLTQYALKDVKIAIAEYNADPDNRDSLIYRTRHIHHVLAFPKATSGKDVESLMLWLRQELKDRQSGQKERIPMVVVFDEFFAFSNTYKPKIGTTVWKEGDITSDEGETRITQKTPTYWEILMSILSDLRKNGIRVIIAVQDPASAQGTTMRQVRDMFRYRLIMNLGIGGAKLLGIDDKASQQLITKLPPGFIFLRDMEDVVIGVPYPINQQWIDLCKDTLAPSIPQAVDWTPDYAEQYLAQLMKDAKVYVINKDLAHWPIDTKEDLIEFLVVLGWSQNKIEQTIRGDSHRIREIYKEATIKHLNDV